MKMLSATLCQLLFCLVATVDTFVSSVDIIPFEPAQNNSVHNRIDYFARLEGKPGSPDTLLLDQWEDNVRPKKNSTNSPVHTPSNPMTPSQIHRTAPATGRPLRVVLHNHNVHWHGEIIFSVMRLVSLLYPQYHRYHGIHFFVDHKIDFSSQWHSEKLDKTFHWTSAVTKPLFKRILRILKQNHGKDWLTAANPDSPAHSVYDAFDLLVLTTAFHDSEYDLMANKKKLMVIAHKCKPMYLRGNNIWALSSSKSCRNVSERTLTPIELPVDAGRGPNCRRSPVFIVQGTNERRDLQTLEMILSAPSLVNASFEIRLLSYFNRSAASFNKYPSLISDPRVIGHAQHRSMDSYVQNLQNGTYLMPLIHPVRDPDNQRYLHGHPSSSIAYCIHFRLRMVAHAAVLKEYEPDLGTAYGRPFEKLGYWYTDATLVSEFQRALDDFSAWCSQSEPRPDWVRCDTCTVKHSALRITSM